MTSVLAGVRSRDSLDNQALVTDNYARTHIVLERRSLQEQNQNQGWRLFKLLMGRGGERGKLENL